MFDLFSPGTEARCWSSAGEGKGEYEVCSGGKRSEFAKSVKTSSGKESGAKVKTEFRFGVGKGLGMHLCKQPIDAGAGCDLVFDQGNYSNGPL